MRNAQSGFTVTELLFVIIMPVGCLTVGYVVFHFVSKLW